MIDENQDKVVRKIKISEITNNVLEFAAERYNKTFDEMIDEIILYYFFFFFDDICELEDISDEKMLKTKELWLVRKENRHR